MRVIVDNRVSPLVSPVVLHMLDGVDDFVDQLKRNPRDNALSICERTLEGAQRDPSFLCRDAREKLFETNQFGGIKY